MFDKPYEGTHDTAERLHLVEANQLRWNPSVDTLLDLRCSRIIFSAEMTPRLSSAAVSCIYLRELC